MTTDALLAQLTIEEKVALTSGSGFSYTVPVGRLGIPQIRVFYGQQGLRGVPQGGDPFDPGVTLTRSPLCGGAR
jgi:beta-glucosidase